MNPSIHIALMSLSISVLSSLVAEDAGLLAHYTFEEGAGAVLKDHSGNGRDGQIHGAKWVKGAAGGALSFQPGDYVDLGTDPAFNLPGDRTIAAWVKPESPSFPDPQTNWEIFNGGDAYSKSGYLLRIDGDSTKVSYRHNGGAKGFNCFSRRSIENNTFVYIVVTRKGDTASLYIDGMLDLQFEAHDPAPAERCFSISDKGQSFIGLIDDVAIHRRAWSTDEIIRRYQQGAARRGKDTSWIGKIRLIPYGHYRQGNILVEAGFAGILPLQPGQQASLELGLPGKPPVRTEVIKTMPETGQYEHTFPIQDLPEGKYQIAAMVKDASGQVLKQAAVAFAVPYEPAQVTGPSEKTVSPLPKPPEPVPYELELAEGGGFQIRTGGENYPVESAFSWPKGDFNRLGISTGGTGDSETDWKVATRRVNDRTYRVSASGEHYRLERTIRLYPARINVQDTLTNRTPEPIGIIFKNTVVTKNRGIVSARVAGMESLKPKAGSEIKSNPTLFLKKPGLGIGLVALDDVYIVQSKADFDLDRSSLYSTQFALDRGASYTLEWSIYLNGSADYYDFINQVRKDEKRNGKVDGGLALYHDRYHGRHGIPTREYVTLRNIKYLNLGGLDHPADDPQVTLDGIEFLQYPKEMARMKAQIAAIRKLSPEVKVMFHVAHSLYATSKPTETFPDSRVIRADGKQAIYYENQEGAYLSEERKKQGWRWWTVYPALNNSFGRELMRSVDVMVDDMGCQGVFMDGFMSAYGSEYTYAQWDGHTADIDPTTRTITRKVGSVLLLSQDALAAFSRKMRDKGGQVVANNSVITRTIGKETHIIYEAELQEGPWTHLAPSVAALSNAYRFSNEREFYYDALNKLKWGNLTFYYGDYPNGGKDFFTRPPIVAQMYPITFEEIHEYYVKGQERLITARPGVYGWARDPDLHFSHRYDAQGWEIPAGYLTTVDRAGVRTEVTLAEKEAAVVKKVPVRLKSSGPVNVVFRQYDAQGVVLGLNGPDKVKLTVASGEFEIQPGHMYRVKADQDRRLKADSAGRLAFTCRLRGPLEISITPDEE